jgi:hypothetical protein
VAVSDHRHNERDEQQRRAQEAVGSLGRVPADPDFRARLREQFVAGALDEGQADPSRLEKPAAGVTKTGPALWRRPAAWAPLAAAAVLAFILVGFNPLPGPQLLDLAGSGPVLIDGREFAASDRPGIEQALQGGSTVVLGPEVTLDLLYPGTMAMRLEAGTELSLPERPGRWFGRQVQADLPLGEVSIRTGPELTGGAILVSTPEGVTTVTGTLISVFRNTEVTCVCLFEGSASVATADAELGTLPPRQRWVVFSDGREPALMAIEPGHEAHMLDFDAKWRHVLGLD